jgi:hypothetical protein
MASREIVAAGMDPVSLADGVALLQPRLPVCTDHVVVVTTFMLYLIEKSGFLYVDESKL